MTFRERRAHLAHLLRNHPDPSSFNMRAWSTCASGVATSDPVFNEMGLTSDPNRHSPLFEDAHGFEALYRFFGFQGTAAPHFWDIFGARDNENLTALDVAHRLEVSLR